MTDFLIVVAIIATYCTVGAFYARSQALSLYKAAKKQWWEDR